MPPTPFETAGLDALLAAARGGDRAAEEALFGLLSARILEVAKRRLRSEEEARDIAAETLATAWRRYREAPMPGGFLPWTFTILRNKIGNAMRRERTTRRLVPLEAADAVRVRPGAGGSATNAALAPDGMDDEIDRARLEARVRAALRALPAECRRIFALLFRGATRAEILAAFPGEPAGTVDSRLSRCRRRLHERLAAEGWEA